MGQGLKKKKFKLFLVSELAKKKFGCKKQFHEQLFAFSFGIVINPGE